MADWLLTPLAERDLEDIWEQGAQHWGIAQAERYHHELIARLDLLAEFPGIARLRPEFTPPLRLLPHGAHLVIYREEGAVVTIIRVLHMRQNHAALLSD